MLDIFCISLGVYFLFTELKFSLFFLSSGLNIMALKLALPGHPLMDSLVLTSIVIGYSILSLWKIYR